MLAQRYKIYEKLGVGGSGAVYRAYDGQLKRWVAIKRLLSAEEAAIQNSTAEELHREANTLASMRHSSIVTIYDVATDEEGLFIVMELLTGPDLSNTLAHGPLGLDDFKQLAEQILEALIAAHDLHILHRDIKPENIKVERLPGGRLQAKIIDFGLARAGLAARKQTESGGAVMGSIYYIAPEQLSRKPTDQRTDLYSLGCVLYETLSGRKAFEGRTVNEVIDKHLNHDVTPLSANCPHLPHWLTYWVHRLMEKEPENRPQTAQRAIEEFRAWEKLPPNPATDLQGGYTPAYSHVQTPTTHEQPVIVYHTTRQHPTRITSYQIPTVLNTGQITSHIIPAQPQSEPAPLVRQTTSSNLNKKKEASVSSNKSPPWLAIAITAAVVGLVSFFLFGKKYPNAQPTVSSAHTVQQPLQVNTSQTSNKAQNNSNTTKNGSINPIEATLLFREKANEELYPKYRPFPILDNYRCMHYIASLGTHGYTKTDKNTFALIQRWQEPLSIWDDLSACGDNTPLISMYPIAESSPKTVAWKKAAGNSPAIKEQKTGIRFTGNSKNTTGLRSYFTSEVKAQLPFATSSKINILPPGLTIIGCASIYTKNLSMDILTLSAPEKQTTAHLFINEKNNLVLGMYKGNEQFYVSPLKSDTSAPFVFAVRWSKETGVKINVWSSTLGSFQADKPADFIPDCALHELILGKASNNSNLGFTGILGELVIYSIALKDDELKLLQQTMSNDYFHVTDPYAPK